jgi:hypothetical protein
VRILTCIKLLFGAIQLLLGTLLLFWVLLLGKLGYLCLTGGPQRVRAYLLHISGVYWVFPHANPDTAALGERVYQALFLLLAMTWALREVVPTLHKWIVANELKNNGSKP